jgi:HSP20 family protein
MVSSSQCAPPAAPTRSDRRPDYRPDFDIVDRRTEVVLLADMPGATAGAIDVTFHDGVLEVRAALAPRGSTGRPIRQEYGVGDYTRAFRLGDGFDGNRIDADYRRGVLTVRVPRLAAALPRTVEVRAG